MSHLYVSTVMTRLYVSFCHSVASIDTRSYGGIEIVSCTGLSDWSIVLVALGGYVSNELPRLDL